jgi:hypothetical protein
MNRLPKVLQNEIWEYVRGDRAYWKQAFSANWIKLNPKWEHLSEHFFNGGVVEVRHYPEIGHWWVRLFHDGHYMPIRAWPFKTTKDSAMITFNQIKELHKF